MYHSNELEEYRFLVTGGAGFIGSNLVKYLHDNNAGFIRVLDDLSGGHLHNIEPYMDSERFEFIEGDIRDLETCKSAVKDMDFVSHQAALGSVPRSIDTPLLTNSVNITGFLNMLVASKNEGVKRFVYAASSSTYGDSTSLPKVEDHIGKPLSPYAVTKLVNELYADVFYKIYGLQSIGLRYFNVYGPNQDPNGAYAAVIPLFFKAALQNEPPIMNGDGLQTRDFTYVANAVQANIRSFFAGEEAVNEVFNVAVGERIDLLRLWEEIRKLCHCTIEPLFGPPRPGDVRDSLADVTKAERLIGYKNLVYLDEGLKRAHEYYTAIFRK